MTDPIELRKQLRSVLSAVKKRMPIPEDLVKSYLERAMGASVTVQEMMMAIEWNQVRGYVDFRYNSDYERDEWFLTDSGMHKEGLS